MIEKARSSPGSAPSPPPGPPAWTDRLAALLAAADTGAICTPVLDWLRRNGWAPAKRFMPAAVLIVLAEQTPAPGVLLTRRRDDLAVHPGQVAFPGGAVEPPDRDAEQAALREAEEEVALAPERVRVLGRLPRYPTTTGYLVTPVVGYVSAPPPLRAQPEEVADIFMVPFTVLLDDTRWLNRPIGAGNDGLTLPELAWGGQRIWGATAGMLQLLIPSLRQAWEAES